MKTPANVHCAFDRMFPVGDLKPNPRNPARHPNAQLELLAGILAKQGWRSPIIVSKRSGLIVAGHGRLEAAKMAGMTEVPVNLQDFPSDEAELAHLLADNKLAELADMDDAAVIALLKELEDTPESELTGFDDKALMDLIAESNQTAEEEEDDVFAATPEHLPGALALKTDMAFPSDEIYGIPCFLPNMLASCPETITTWAGRDVTEESEHYFYNVSTDSVRGLDFAKTVVGFYTDDHRFEAAWLTPDLYTAKLINRAPMAVVSPNFSLWFESPKAVKIWNTYRSRWVGRYFQEAGIKIIPDVNFSDEASFEYCFAGIPRNAPCVSIQIQTGKKTQDEIDGKRAAIAEALKRLTPESILFYCGDGYEAITNGIVPKEMHSIFIANRVQKRRKAMTKTKG